MAKIQNPQNEKGELLATDNKVQELTSGRLVPLEDSFRNIGNDQFIKVEKGEPDTENNYFKTKISANYTDDINDINVDTIEKENNKLVTTKLLKNVKDTIGINIEQLETAIGKEIDAIIEAETKSKKEVEDRFTNLEEDLEEHITDGDIHITDKEREKWDSSVQEVYGDNTYITAEKDNTNRTLSLNVDETIDENSKKVPTSVAVKTYVDNTVDEHKKDTIGTELSTWDIETTFADGANNVFDFTCNSPFTGILTEVRLYCSPKTAAGGESYLEIRQNDKILARSSNAQDHSTDKLLKFNFNNILLNLGERYSFYIVDKNGSKPSKSCLALNLKTDVPEVADLNVVVGNYPDHTTRFGFTYYKSNREIISNTLNTLNSDLVYDISYKYSNLNNITNVTNRTITFADDSKIDFPIGKITHGKYAFRAKSNTTSPLTEFNLRIMDGGKPGSDYDSAYYYERDVRNSSYDEDVGGNLETLGNLINGDGMFIRSGITVFNDDLSCLIRARQMFTNSSLTTFRSALPSLTFGDRMFLGTKLTEFKIKLPSLSSAECMFRLCKNLEFVDTCLPNLTFAQGMFGYCTALERIDLSPSSGANLYLADNMFTGCENLTSVKLNLEYLENAKDMFAPGVYSNITYNAPLLDLPSVINIANTIKDWTNDYYTDKVHEIAIGINETSEIYNSGDSSYKQYIDQIADKNWKVSLYTSNSRQSPAFTIIKD